MQVCEKPEGLSGLVVGDKARSEWVGLISIMCLLILMTLEEFSSTGVCPSSIIEVRCALTYTRCVYVLFNMFLTMY